MAWGLGIGLTLAPAAHAADKPYQIAPEKKSGKERRAARRAADTSEEGTRNGALEFGLGSVAAVVTAVVIARGIWELTQIDEARRDCLAGAAELACSDPATFARGNRIAAGLSFGFAVHLGVATGFLFARGVRTRRDWQAWHREYPQAPEVSLMPRASRRGGGLALHVRF